MDKKRVRISKLSVAFQTPKMNDALLNELRTLLNVLGECLTSFRKDFNSLDCNSSQSVIASIVFKLEKAAECANSILKICKSLKKESIPCLPCLSGSVDNQSSKKQEPPS